MASGATGTQADSDVCNLQDNASVTEISCITERKLVGVRYMWTIKNFSSYTEEIGEYLESSTFSAGGDDVVEWCLRLYPKGVDVIFKDHISLGIQLVSSNKPIVSGNCMFAILTATGEKTNEFSDTIKNMKQDINWIKKSYQFIVRNDLMSMNKNLLLPEDNLTIFCEMSLMNDCKKIGGQSNSIKIPKCRLSRDLGYLFENEHFYDVTLVAGETEIKAHKAILAARSPVFATMFKHDMQESKTNRVEILDVKFEVLREMVRFIYTGRALNLNKTAGELLVAADKYALKRLRVMCEEALCKNISVVTAADVLVIADLHSAEQLKALTLDFINMNLKEVMATEGWRSMTLGHPQMMEAVCGKLAG